MSLNSHFSTWSPIWLSPAHRGLESEESWITIENFVPSLIEFGQLILIISSMYFCYFVIISPWESKWPLFEQTWNYFIHVWMSVQSLVEIGQSVLEEKICQFRQCISVISLLYYLRKGSGPLIEQTWKYFTLLGCFVPSLVEIGSLVLEKQIFKSC